MEFTDTRQGAMYVRLFYDLQYYTYEKKGAVGIFVHEGELARYINMLSEKPIYRIMIMDDTTVETDCYDLLENFAPELNSYYSNTDELPQWAQDKLAVLMLLDHNVVNKEVEGVGKRINEHIFWLYKEGEHHGDDARG